MADSSFDIVSEINYQELNNALDQTRKELATRYDFKDIIAEIKLEDNQLTITVPDEYKLKALMDIIHSKMIHRGLDLHILGEQKTEPASGGSIRTVIQLVEGINQESAKKINKLIREQLPKIKTVIQGDTIRVSSKSRDELQSVMQLLKDNSDLGLPLQFINYR